MDRLALDVREQLSDPTHTEQTSQEPRIVDPVAYEQRVAAMGNSIRVNLGCGEKPLPEYINIDARELPEVDIIADARNIPFAKESLLEIASAHLVEHFREHQLRTRILSYWKSLLQPDGFVRIICPNWEVMLHMLQKGEMTLPEFKLLTFGGQDYVGDDHFAMYTPETLRQLLTECSFGSIEIVIESRMNGLCPEMEIIAYN